MLVGSIRRRRWGRLRIRMRMRLWMWMWQLVSSSAHDRCFCFCKYHAMADDYYTSNVCVRPQDLALIVIVDTDHRHCGIYRVFHWKSSMQFL
ncbi:hypothetical protein CPB84DRAFT_1793021, partial [Gymnopilus junonius]